jgi:sialate O-acetylesterase
VKRLLALCLSWLAVSCAVAADPAPPAKPTPAIELGAPFADNAILQREMPVPVWGWSTPGTKVTVEFAGQKKTTTAGADGKWTASLDPLTANATPAEMTVTDDAGKKVVIKNVLVGEVWMASGQSNMQWKVAASSVQFVAKQLAEEAKAAGTALPPIREGVITDAFSALHPVEHATLAWSDGSDYSGYSAVAFAFAVDLWKELRVPIGILNCSFSQTSIESWTPRVGFSLASDDYNKAIATRLLETDPATPEHVTSWKEFAEKIEAALADNVSLVAKKEPAKPVAVATPGNMNGNRDASWLFNARINPVVPYAIRGAIWNQGYANIGGGLTYYDNLHALIPGWRKVWNRPDLPVYYNQFYAPGAKDGLAFDPMAEMRLGAWLARDIPHTGMASQIDITGTIHYFNKALSGQRMARHALKNQYGKKDVVADGPMLKGYRVEGDTVVVELDHTDGGLVVAKTPAGSVLEVPEVIENGAEQVTLFYVADKDRVWHRAKVRIDGSTLVVTAAGVKEPRGVAYGCLGVGPQPGIFNKALLPLTPFIQYDGKLVTSRDWPGGMLAVAGVTVDPSTVGKGYEYRKMPLLAQPFDDHAVLQADAPITIWGSAVHDFGYEAKGKAEIAFSFAGTEQKIPVTPGMKEWKVTLPAMKASMEPKTLHVTFSIDGEKVHERLCKDIVIGDVWYVSGTSPQTVELHPGSKPAADGPILDDGATAGPVRVMTRKASRAMSPRPSRYMVSTSLTPHNRYASFWLAPKDGPAGAFAARLHKATGRPVGVVFMSAPNLELKHWIGFDQLAAVPSLKADYENISAALPGSPAYDADVRQYLAAWKKYWAEEVPKLIATKRHPHPSGWGEYPSLGGEVTATAAQAYNVMTSPFADFRFKGIVFLTGPKMVAGDEGASFAEQLPALAASWRATFGGDPAFYYTLPAKSLAPRISAPQGIAPPSTAIEVTDWNESTALEKILAAP